MPTTFDYSWSGDKRTQRLTRVAPALGPAGVPDEWLESDIWHLGPVANEIDQTIIRRVPNGSFVGATPQGWMRKTDANSVVISRPWSPAAELIARLNALVFSRDDLPSAEGLAKKWSESGPVVAVTAAGNGATVFANGRVESVPAYSVVARNELGAGDVFAAVFFVCLAGRSDPIAAARAANAAAAIVVSHDDPSDLATPRLIESLTGVLPGKAG